MRPNHLIKSLQLGRFQKRFEQEKHELMRAKNDHLVGYALHRRRDEELRLKIFFIPEAERRLPVEVFSLSQKRLQEISRDDAQAVVVEKVFRVDAS